MKNVWRGAAVVAALFGAVALADQATTTTTTQTNTNADDQTVIQDQQQGVGGAYTVTTRTEETTSPVMQPYPWTLSVLGGVEGYSGSLASRISPGGTYGVALGVEPFRFLGFELGYSGGVNNVRNFNTGATGPDITRNGGYLIATPGITGWLNGTGTSSLKPYLLGGIGLDGYNVNNSAAQAAGFQNKTMGNVPFGAGLELRVSQFVANARFNYKWEFGGNNSVAGIPLNNGGSFALNEGNPLSYQGQLSVGGAF